ncbi:MAG: response regulator [Spirochaetales bacterium]|nr:response regulator [Spirochaetales bacterium]
MGFYLVHGILRERMRIGSEENIDVIEANIRGGFAEAELILDSSYYRVQRLLDRGESRNILSLLTDITAWMRRLTTTKLNFYGIYGYIQEEFIDSIDLHPGSDYIPRLRPWYEAVVREGKRIVYTPPYIDAKTGDPIISLSRNIYGENGGHYGVLTLDVELSRLDEYVVSIGREKGSYGVLVNQFQTILAHPDKKYEGLPLRDLSREHAGIAAMIQQNQPIDGRIVTNANGVEIILFGRNLFNGWHVSVCTPVASYYNDINTAIIHLSVLALVFVILLSLIIIRISAAQLRADDMSRQKSSFLARMSHNIRTPLNAIIGMSELALRINNPAQIMEYVGSIKQAGHNLLSLLNDILDISRIETGSIYLSPVSYTMESLINDVINIIRVRVAEKPVIFCVNIDNKIPNHLQGDETRIRQLLLNLLSNAVNFTPEGFIRLTVRFTREQSDRIMIAFEVADSGIGIKQENLADIFNTFIHLDQDLGGKAEGSGLGLAISRNICRLMGGEITVSSEYGRGSVFIATIFQTVIDNAILAAVEDPGEKSVLCYEPDAVYADSMRRTLEGFRTPVTMTTEKDAFFRELAEGSYAFAFAPADIAEDAARRVKEASLSVGLVILVYHGEISSFQNFPVIQMPAWAVPVANTLNYQTQADRRKRSRVRFIAPRAKVLIVDDIMTNLQVIAGFLSLYQVQIDRAANGAEALALVKQNQYDLVFMDHMMPVMDGIEATTAIRALDGDYRNLPIVALTANAMVGMREMFLEKGFSDYLSKPIEIGKLDAMMTKWIPFVMQEKPDSPDSETDRETGILDGYEVEGIDFHAGRKLYGNDEAYLRILRFYIMESPALLEKMRTVTEETLGAYAITVHGIKGASMSICAADIGREALALEKAAKAGDLAFVQTHNAAFLENLGNTLEKLKAFLGSMAKPETEKPRAAAPNRKMLSGLLQECKQYKISGMERILLELEAFEYERGGDLIPWLREQIYAVEYENIQKRLENILAEKAESA